MGSDNKRSRLATAAELRRRAEEIIRGVNPADTNLNRMPSEAQRLVHELEVHSIELEMQNAELRQARDKEEKDLETYTDLYDYAPVGYFTLDRDGTIRSANLTGASLLGIERASLPGQSFERFVSAADRPAFTTFLDKVFSSRDKQECEVQLLNNGNLPLTVQLEAMADASGQECRSAVIDISERKRMESRTAHLASFPQLNPNPVLEVNISGRITFFNPAALKSLETLGMDEGDIAVFLPSDMKDILESWDRINEATLYREIVIKDREFEETIFMTPQFKVARIYACDISERKRAEDLLRQANAELTAANFELEAFNYSVSHDLRRPLTIIHGYCQVLRDLHGDQLDEQSREYIREIHQGSLRMNRLISTLLNFSLVTRVEIHREMVDLSAMAKAVAAELILAEPERRVTFRIAEGITADCDACLWRIALDNLMGNAWKFSGQREEPVIEFGVTEVGGKPVCFVRDNGPGFDMAYSNKLFVPFQRIPGTDTEGQGIGLATVERIVRRHGGRVWAESDPGKGATFLFTLE